MAFNHPPRLWLRASSHAPPAGLSLAAPGGIILSYSGSPAR